MSPFCRWHPAHYIRFEEAFATSVGTSRIITDAGPAYLKALGNPQGPHVLACEWVGTRLAEWFGLQTFDYDLLVLDTNDEVPLPGGGEALAGPAFVTRAEHGFTWGGDSRALNDLENPEDVSRLVVFDTWTRNCDRHARGRRHLDNVFLSTEQAAAGRARLVAMDHTHCFTCGGALDGRVGRIDRVQDTEVYGLFPEFQSLVKREFAARAVARLRGVTRDVVQPIVSTLPREWEVSSAAVEALGDLIVGRAHFVAEHCEGWLAPLCWPQGRFDLSEE